MKKLIFNILKSTFFLSLLICSGILFSSNYNGKEIFQNLNRDPNNPFALSIGTSISQTKRLENTVNPKFIREKLQSLMQKIPEAKSADWLKNKDRYWFVLDSLPTYFCKRGDFIDPVAIGKDKHSVQTQNLFENLAANRLSSKLNLTKCPYCDSDIVKEDVIADPVFTKKHESAMLKQLQYLGVDNQSSNLPNYRISLEAADVLQPGTDIIDQKKLEEQSKFISNLGNPMLFMHHYSNPLSKENLFEKSEDVGWFSNYCKSIIEKSSNVTHVCPISQPIAFSFRPRRQGLPPFESNVSQDKFLENITNAQIRAAKEMKAVRKSKGGPDLNVLLSHQWKLMKPKHTSLTDPRNYLERLVASIAHKMYNQKFVDLVTPHLKEFDGIALSLYPPVYFNNIAPEADNCSGIIDEAAALETIQEVHKAFPKKDIYIVETGCNSNDPQTKIDFIDMTLNVCKVAREQGIPVKGVYFWGQTNDPEFYSEWNAAPGSTHFGPFDKLDTVNPEASINAAGKHIKEILQK